MIVWEEEQQKVVNGEDQAHDRTGPRERLPSLGFLRTGYDRVAKFATESLENRSAVVVSTGGANEIKPSSMSKRGRSESASSRPRGATGWCVMPTSNWATSIRSGAGSARVRCTAGPAGLGI